MCLMNSVCLLANPDVMITDGNGKEANKMYRFDKISKHNVINVDENCVGFRGKRLVKVSPAVGKTDCVTHCSL